MNIFYLDKNPKICASYHNDKHVLKMLVETGQLLSSAHWMTGSEAPYKKTHVNHPCAIWTRESIDNYNWLCEMGMFLCEEYTSRYHKTHKTSSVIWWLRENKPNLPKIGFTEPPQAMPDPYKVPNNSVKAYRNYYLGEKLSFSTWKNGYIPDWLS